MTIAQNQDRWRVWLDTIKQDITTVYLWRATWQAVADMVQANRQIPPSHFWAYMSNTYGTSQALAVRRLADRDPRAVSLARLIKDLQGHALEITLDWWLAVQPGADIREFARFQQAGTNHFDPAIANQDLDRLRVAVVGVKKYVDHHLAHHDQNPTKEIPTFKEVHSALDSVGTVFRKYYMLLTGADWAFFVPTPHIGWYKPFTMPWLPPGSPPLRLKGTVGSDPL